MGRKIILSQCTLARLTGHPEFNSFRRPQESKPAV
uniref:Uncharacterized protein n=1 Tax=Anguilla anguilla TaxID=7936 RepID=A0A0E9R5C9_ANGAN